ncbi:hypothetical protein [Marinospirillum insulare]|uniref:Tetratricopeptide repeat-containing protein n=1 Tax=Marinospirillum insulare TaxID=217169 RepID=A0ABQ5ZYT5_9GAMM|nr:hypothetical protein [Marinospirillum insulare]GLR64661.1 hypothetical protein GCM10007878_20990 [Marinospirillum insulare]
MNLLSIYNLSRPYFALAFSWRFIAVTLLLLVAAGWYSLTQYSGFNWLNLNLASLPLPVYALWLLAIILSALFAWGCSPVERKLIKAISLANQDLRRSDAEQGLQQANSALFLLPSATIKLGSLQAAFYKSQGEWVKAYNTLQELQALPLLPKERTVLELDLMRLFYASGNFKATQQALTRLQKGRLSQAQQSLYYLTQAELYLIENKFQAAKDLVEQHYAEPNLPANTQVALLHTLGVIDTHLQNYESVIAAYRQAWEILKQQKNSFGQAEITIDNLALTYAKQGELNKLQPFVQQLDALATPNNTDHQLALHNIKINLARQLNDRQALEQAYAQAEENLLPQLEGEQRFFYTVMGLRMHFNDGVDFEKALQATQVAMLNKPAINTLNYLRVIKEISGILNQALERIGPRPDIMTFYSWLLFEFKRLEPALDRLQDEIPPSLPSPKAELISLKVDSLKHEMILLHAQPSKALFEKIFELLEEKKKLWQGIHNPVAHLHELMIILDEYCAYKKALPNTQFEADFKQLAIASLEEAEVLLNDNQANLAYSDKLIGLAYACYQLNTKKEQAKHWLATYDQSKQSTNHLAAWLRQQYQETKAWVGV